MAKVLLLDCSELIEKKLRDQGYAVSAGTVGHCTGVRSFPSQVYENEVIVYDPRSVETKDSEGTPGMVLEAQIKDLTPHYSLEPLQAHIEGGATLLIFLNKISNFIKPQDRAYRWIPFMPSMQFTSDQRIGVNNFDRYPDYQQAMLAPVVTRHDVALPVELKMQSPKVQDYPRDTFFLFWNANQDPLGILLLRGHGRVIILPKCGDSDSVIETFVQRVMPQIYNLENKSGLVDLFSSPEEAARENQLHAIVANITSLREQEARVRIKLAEATRQKTNVINADDTCKRILSYYTEAKRQPDVALFYLYKIIESIENKLGGETAGIAVVGVGTEWKAVKRLANESYRDARHAPKPTDIVKQWSDAEIRKCFADTEKVILAFFTTLFPRS